MLSDTGRSISSEMIIMNTNNNLLTTSRALTEEEPEDFQRQVGGKVGVFGHREMSDQRPWHVRASGFRADPCKSVQVRENPCKVARTARTFLLDQLFLSAMVITWTRSRLGSFPPSALLSAFSHAFVPPMPSQDPTKM